jgi:hypothetical protein
VKHGVRLSATAISIVLWAAKIDPSSDSHCTGCGARIAPKRFSTHRTIIADHLAGDAARRGHPADDLAIVAIEGAGTRTSSPFQQMNSRALRPGGCPRRAIHA